MPSDSTNNNDPAADARTAACCVCGTETEWLCSDCEMDGLGSVRVCANSACRKQHDADDAKRGTHVTVSSASFRFLGESGYD